MPDTSTSSKWELAFVDTAAKKEYNKFFKDHADQRHCQPTYEKNVAENPFHSQVNLRIKKMQGEEWDGFYRWKKSNTKIIYYPDATSRTVYTIETNTSTQISYKKRSK